MEANDVAALLADNLRRLMTLREWNQEQLGKQLGIGSGNVHRLLSGKHPPTASTLAKCATVFEVDLCDLLCPPKKKRK